VEAAREIDATLDRLWRSADHERRMAQAIARHLAPTFGGAAVEDDVIRHARQAQKYVLEARTYQNPPARVVAEALGRHLEPYFISRHRKISSAPNGWRPAGRIAGLVADMTGQQVTETDVRRWCGWKNKPKPKRKPKQLQPPANRSAPKFKCGADLGKPRKV
jgi:hypothetical protein